MIKSTLIGPAMYEISERDTIEIIKKIQSDYVNILLGESFTYIKTQWNKSYLLQFISDHSLKDFALVYSPNLTFGFNLVIHVNTANKSKRVAVEIPEYIYERIQATVTSFDPVNQKLYEALPGVIKEYIL